MSLLNPPCDGNGDDHCCFLSGVVCPHLRTDVPGRKWSCGLYVKYGSWTAMLSSPEYLPIGQHWEWGGQNFGYCMTFVPPDFACCRAPRGEG